MKIVLPVLFLAAFLLIFYFTRPSVCFAVSDALHDDYVKKLSHPHLISAGYRSRVVRDSSLSGNYDLVIVMPPAELSDNANTVYLGMGNGRTFSINETELFSAPLRMKSHDVLAFLYDSADENADHIASELKAEFNELILIPYEGRISSVNLDEIRTIASAADGVIIYSPLSALRFIESSDAELYADWRDAAALAVMKNVIAICPDWNRAIADALHSEISEIPLHFTLSAT